MAQLNKTPMVIRLSTGLEDDITKATAYGWGGEPVFATDTQNLWIFPTTEGAPVKYVPFSLATVTGIDATATGSTEIYTVPTGTTLIVDHIVIRCTAFTVGSKATQAVASFGSNGATYDDYLNSVTYTIAAQDVFIRDSVENSAVVTHAAGQSFRIIIETASDATTETWAVDLFGYLV